MLVDKIVDKRVHRPCTGDQQGVGKVVDREKPR
jgi:hypothetical protein